MKQLSNLLDATIPSSSLMGGAPRRVFSPIRSTAIKLSYNFPFNLAKGGFSGNSTA